MTALNSSARAVMFGLFLLAPALAQTATSSDLSSVTLYSPAKYKLTGSPPLASGQLRPDFSRASFSFTRGSVVGGGDSDISFGMIGPEWFMLTSATSGKKRSVIKDLGKRDWSDRLRVAVLDPADEHRHVSINVSGNAGANGNTCAGLAGYFPGVASVQGRSAFSDPMTDSYGNVDTRMLTVVDNQCHPGNGPRTPKLKPSELFAKAIAGHIYEIHIVDSQHDYYVLLRVDALVAGDNCTFSWRRIPTPSG